MSVIRAAISDQPLDEAQHRALVDDPAAGATVVFCGVVRDHDHGRVVTELEYQAHPSAEQTVRAVAERIAARAEIIAVAVTHRVGTLHVGDPALVAAVSSAHRRAAFTACAELVEEVKRDLPVWKRQVFADGTDEWVNCP